MSTVKNTDMGETSTGKKVERKKTSTRACKVEEKKRQIYILENWNIKKRETQFF